MTDVEFVRSPENASNAEVVAMLDAKYLFARVRAAFEVVKRGIVSDEAKEALKRRKTDSAVFWNDETVGYYMTAALDVLGIEKYSGHNDRIQYYIANGMLM